MPFITAAVGEGPGGMLYVVPETITAGEPDVMV